MMLLHSGLPVTPAQKAIEHIMTQLEMCCDLSNTEKATLAEYVESLEDELRAIIRVANSHGWDGKTTLDGFISDTLAECKMITEGLTAWYKNGGH